MSHIFEFRIKDEDTGEPIVIRGTKALVSFIQRCSGYNLEDSDREEVFRYLNKPKKGTENA